jgi:hypothetical protein
MITIFIFLLPLWITPIKITPDSSLCMFSNPLVVSDNQGKCWFTWSHQNLPVNSYYILGRYYEATSISPVDTVMPENLVMYLSDLIKDRNNNVWVLGEGASEIWAKYRDNTAWSDSIAIPVFQLYDNFSAVSTGDSVGNYCVTWCSDIYLYASIHSSYYNGSSWSTRLQVSDRPYDAFPTDMTTASDSLVWLTWICVCDPTDSLFVSTFNGTTWNTNFCIDGDMSVGEEYSPAVIEASISDDYVYLAYRKANGYIYVLRFVSTQISPDTIWISNEYETTPALGCDDIGHLWLVFCDSLAQHDYRLYYAVWQGDSVTTPQLVDTLDGYNPRVTFDAYHRRMWVAFKSWRDGERFIYATYQNITGLSEEKQVSPKSGRFLTCVPNPFRSKVNIKLQMTILHGYRSLRIFDINGSFVRELTSSINIPRQWEWDAKDYKGNRVSPGIYFAELYTDDNRITVPLIRIK